jgi:integrase
MQYRDGQSLELVTVEERTTMKPDTPKVTAPNHAGRVCALDIIQGILDRGEDAMKQRYQDPKILTRTDVARPFYYILVSVPVVTPEGLRRKRQSFQLGFCDEITMREAKSRKQQILAPINAGNSIIQSQIRFRDLARKFEEARIPQLGAATQAKYRAHLQNHVLPAFRDMLLCEITKPTIEVWLNKKAEPQNITVQRNGVEAIVEREGLGWWARQDLRNLLSAIFTQATEWKLWDGANPCEGVNVGKKKVKRTKRIPGPEDLTKFLESIPDTAIIGADGAGLIVVVAVVAGLRVSEVLGLQVGDVDARGETLHVERRQHRGDVDDPKSEASRRVRQVGALASQLLRYATGRGPDDFIFLRKDGRMLDDRDLQQHVFRPAAEAVGIYHPGFGMHTFRRLNVTWRQEVGATPLEAQKAAGHASLDMTYLYTQTDEAREREHVGRILDRLKNTKDATLAAMPTGGPVQ